MNDQLIYVFLFIGGYLLLISFCEYLNRRKHIASEHTRKLAHVVSTLSVLLYPYIFTDYMYALVLSLACCILLLVANRMRVLHSIDGVGRRTGGSYLLALAVGITYYISVSLKNNLLYTLPILVLAVSDPLAGIVGKQVVSKKILNGKTIAGSLAFLISSWVISLICLALSQHEHIFILSATIALTAMLTELISPRGTDNLTIPLAIIGLLVLMY